MFCSIQCALKTMSLPSLCNHLLCFVCNTELESLTNYCFSDNIGALFGIDNNQFQ